MIVELLLFGSLALIVLIPVIGDNPNDVLRGKRLARASARSRRPIERYALASRRMTRQHETALVDHWSLHGGRADVKAGWYQSNGRGAHHLSKRVLPGRRPSPS